MPFTKEELEEMAAADAEIEAEFDELSWTERMQSERLEQLAITEALSPEERWKREKNNEYQRSVRRKQSAKRKEKLAADKRVWYQKNKEKEAARKAEWYAANRERILAHQKAYRERRRAATAKAEEAVYAENRERIAGWLSEIPRAKQLRIVRDNRQRDMKKHEDIGTGS